VKTVADAGTLRSLLQRFSRLQPHARRRWGTLTAQEMLCHLGDSMDMVLGTRPRLQPLPPRRRGIVKLVGLWSTIPFPRGWRTSPRLDPKAEGTKPAEFTADRMRVIDGLERLAAGERNIREPVHGVFGTMSTADWQRWAWKHADHHLRQFGV
jgi:hypothetical protein